MVDLLSKTAHMIYAPPMRIYVIATSCFMCRILSDIQEFEEKGAGYIKLKRCV